MLWTPRNLLKLFILGGLGGTLYDQIHVLGRVLAYPDPVLFQQSWWVVPNFGLGVLLLALTGRWLARWSLRLVGRPNTEELLVNLAWFTLAYLASALLTFPPPVVLAIFVTTWLLRVLPRADRLPQLLQGLGLAVVGVLWELLFTKLHLFHYLHPDFAVNGQGMGVATWLPGLYMHGGPLAICVLAQLEQPKMTHS